MCLSGRIVPLALGFLEWEISTSFLGKAGLFSETCQEEEREEKEKESPAPGTSKWVNSD